MQIESDRLLLIPLTYEHLILYLQGEQKLERALNLEDSGRTISPELIEAFHETILISVANPANDYLYYTLWNVIDKTSRQMVADLCFKGEPNAKGEIEIGYGTYPAFTGKGYMTDAIRVLVKWAFDQPDVKTILAETERTNTASHRTLEKNNFIPFKVKGEMIWWRLIKK